MSQYLRQISYGTMVKPVRSNKYWVSEGQLLRALYISSSPEKINPIDLNNE